MPKSQITRISDVFTADVVDADGVEAAVINSALWGQGVVRTNPKLDAFVGSNLGRKAQMNFYRQLADPTDEGNYSGTGNTTGAEDNPAHPTDDDILLTPHKTTLGQHELIKNYVAYSIGNKQVTELVNWLQDPLGALVGSVSNFWTKYYDMYALATLEGLIAWDKAQTPGTQQFVHDGSAGVIDDAAIIDAELLMGDNQGALSLMIVHSKTYGDMRKANMVSTYYDRDSLKHFNYYGDARIIISDKVPVAAGPLYTTLLCAPGVFEYGQSLAGIIGSEVWRDPREGHGGGEEQLITRNQFAMHPYGFTWLDDTVTIVDNASQALWPILADLKLASNWDFVAADRRTVPWVAIETQ